MGTKEVDSWSTPSTRLAKLTTEGEDIAESGREGWIGASAARAVEWRFEAAQGESTSNSINRQKRFFGPVMIQKLRITLYDDFGRILDLNNMDWALELAFECVYSM